MVGLDDIGFDSVGFDFVSLDFFKFSKAGRNSCCGDSAINYE